MKQIHWTDNVLIALDFESTGIDTKTARILQAAVVTFDPDGTLVEDDRIMYVDPECEIPEAASAVHGITTEKLRELNAVKSAEIIPYIYRLIRMRATSRQYPLVIYNAPYDLSLLLAECERIPGYNPSKVTLPFILDPLTIDRSLDKYRKGSRKLEDTAKFYGVQLDGAHDAAADARASLGIMSALIKAYPKLKSYDLPTLQNLQKDWYEEWKAGINAFWEKQGKADRVNGSWPIGEGNNGANS